MTNFLPSALVFDLDNTLYPASCSFFAAVEERMTAYVQALLKLERAAAFALQKQYFLDYGTTLIGLMRNHRVDPHHFMDYVHDVDTGSIPDNPVLRRYLANFTGRRVVFTNGSRRHAENILKALNLIDHMDAIFDIHQAGYRPKPDIQTYQAMLAACRVNPTKAVMFEDLPQNLAPAHALGMQTVLITPDGNGEDFVNKHYIHHVAACPGVWLEERNFKLFRKNDYI
ncbi:MAG: pyrimidine 5'-nucleotidase [Holosporales bacterium]|jgi:putative hydrolase of the HAD superfamily